MNLNQITLPAVDIAQSAAFYRLMGCEQIVDTPHYARFCAPVGDTTFSIHLSAESAARTDVVIYFECERLDAQVAALQQRGIGFTKLPTDERWLWREARLLDPAGNVLCLYWAGANRKDPPWRVRPPTGGAVESSDAMPPT